MDHINYRTLIYQYFRGTISREGREKLFQWIHQSDENKAQFNAYKEIYELTNDIYPQNEPDTDATWENLKNKIEFESPQNKTLPLYKKPVINLILKVAAIVILVLGIGIILFPKKQQNTLIVSTNESKKMIVLPDSTQVWVNKETKLFYVNDFNNKRVIKLIGEGFFKVKKTNLKKPFIVNTPKGSVSVLGTSFLIKAFPDKYKTEEVYVKTGNVKYSSKKNHSHVILYPGDMGYTREGEDFNKTTNKDNNYLAWKTDTLVFDNQLHYIVNVLEDYFDIHIAIENPELLKYNFTGKFIDPELNDVFSVLSASMNLRIRYIDSKHYIITGEGKK